jgi:hypothetical protein
MWSTGRDELFPKILFVTTNADSVQKIIDRFPKTGRAGSHLFRSLLESASNLPVKLLSKNSVLRASFVIGFCNNTAIPESRKENSFVITASEF